MTGFSAGCAPAGAIMPAMRAVDAAPAMAARRTAVIRGCASEWLLLLFRALFQFMGRFKNLA